MSEKFRIDSPFRNRPAVDREIFSCPAAAVLMYYLGDILLADTALAADQDGKVRRSDRDRYLQSPVEKMVVAYNVEFIF